MPRKGQYNTTLTSTHKKPTRASTPYTGRARHAMSMDLEALKKARAGESTFEYASPKDWNVSNTGRRKGPASDKKRV